MILPMIDKAWREVRRVLCIRLDSLGDVLMTTPAFHALRSVPNVEHITLLTSPAGVEVGNLVPDIDEVWSAEVAWLKHTPVRASPTHDWQLVNRIAAADFDACVIFTVNTQSSLPSAMCCYLAGIPLRLAYCRENPYQLLSHWVRDLETPDTTVHEVVRQLELVRSIGAIAAQDQLRIHVRPKTLDAMCGRLRSHGLGAKDHQARGFGDRKWCVVHPGATAASRRYPAESYAEVAIHLEKLGFRILLTGKEAESQLLRSIAARCDGATEWAGEMKVEELAALIQLAPLLLTNNTGPAHLAAAVGTPVVDLYALTNLQHTPWRVPQRVLSFDVPCRNCLKSFCPELHHACLRRIEPEMVVQAVIELWSETQTEAQLETRLIGNGRSCTP